MKPPFELLCAATLTVCGAPAAPLPPRSDASIEVRVGPRPVDVVAGDVDGDGALDLLSANAGDQTISVRLRRDGRWVPAPGDPIPVDLHLHLIALGDLDADGDLDLVGTGHDEDGVSAWLGDGTGRFTAAPGSPFASVGAARPHNHGLAVGDLDGDGDADVIAADQEARAIGVLLADGRGGLAPAPASPIALGGEPYPPALGDLDGDGRLDLVVPLLTSPEVEILLGDAQGGFRGAPGSPYRTPLGRPYAVILGDLDRNGALDVIAIHDDTDRVSILLGDGTGRLRAGPGSPVSFGRRVWRGATADADGDGDLDVVAAGSGVLMVVPGDGRGGLGRPREIGPVGGWVAIAPDLDGDGRPDLTAPDGDAGVLRIWLGR